MADLSSGHSILLVNDDVDLLDSTQARLNDVGYTVTTAKGGDVAIGLLAQNVFEVSSGYPNVKRPWTPGYGLH